jgi:hypothetical protein
MNTRRDFLSLAAFGLAGAAVKAADAAAVKAADAAVVHAGADATFGVGEMVTNYGAEFGDGPGATDPLVNFARNEMKSRGPIGTMSLASQVIAYGQKYGDRLKPVPSANEDNLWLRMLRSAPILLTGKTNVDLADIEPIAGFAHIADCVRRDNGATFQHPLRRLLQQLWADMKPPGWEVIDMTRLRRKTPESYLHPTEVDAGISMQGGAFCFGDEEIAIGLYLMVKSLADKLHETFQEKLTEGPKHGCIFSLALCGAPEAIVEHTGIRINFRLTTRVAGGVRQTPFEAY